MPERNNSNFQIELEEVTNAPTAPPAGVVQMFASGDSIFVQNENNIESVQTGAGGGGTVDSVFGRTAAVVATSGDYYASQIDNDSIIPGATLTGALDTVNTRIDDSGSLLLNASGEFLNKTDSGNFVDLQDSGALQGYLEGYVSTASGHLDEYGLHKTDSGNFLDIADSGNISGNIEATGAAAVAYADLIAAASTGGGLLQTHIESYTPTSSQAFDSTTYADIDGSDVSFTPISSTSKVLYTFMFLSSSTNDTFPILAHLRFLRNGTADADSYTTLAPGGSTGTPDAQSLNLFQFMVPSWGTSAQTLKVQARNYDTSRGWKAHGTYYWEGSVSEQLRDAILCVQEFE